MGLLKNTYMLAKKTANSVIDSATRKLEDAKQKAIEEEQLFLKNFPYQNRYKLLQSDTTSIDLGMWEIFEKDSYVIYDSFNSPIFVANGTTLMGKHHFAVMDSQKHLYCKIFKSIFNVSLPFMKDRKTCKIEISEDVYFEIETYISFKERVYSISGINVSIKANNKDTEFQIFRSKENKPIIHIYKYKPTDGTLNDKYYIGFDDNNDEILAIAITIGIDNIRYSK